MTTNKLLNIILTLCCALCSAQSCFSQELDWKKIKIDTAKIRCYLALKYTEIYIRDYQKKNDDEEKGYNLFKKEIYNLNLEQDPKKIKEKYDNCIKILENHKWKNTADKLTKKVRNNIYKCDDINSLFIIPKDKEGNPIIDNNNQDIKKIYKDVKGIYKKLNTTTNTPNIQHNFTDEKNKKNDSSSYFYHFIIALLAWGAVSACVAYL